MRYPFGPYLPTELEQLERERQARELLEQLIAFVQQRARFHD